jgi:hypothetical protein
MSTFLVPAVTLLFEGGEDSVRSIYNDLRRNIPVIIIHVSSFHYLLIIYLIIN